MNLVSTDWRVKEVISLSFIGEFSSHNIIGDYSNMILKLELIILIVGCCFFQNISMPIFFIRYNSNIVVVHHCHLSSCFISLMVEWLT